MFKINIFKRAKEAIAPEKIEWHDKYNKPIKYAFSAGGNHYYQLLNDPDMPKKRFVYAQQFWEELNMKLTKDTLQDFCTAMKKEINSGDLGKTYKLIDEIEYRLNWAFEPETLMKFASVMYFDLKEDVTDYDMKYSKNKIELWKKKGLLPHFLKILMSDSLDFLSMSESDLLAYLDKQNEELKRHEQLIRDTLGKEDSIPSSTTTSS